MHAVQSLTLSQVRDALHTAAAFGGTEAWEIRMRSALAAPVIDGVRVVECPFTDGDMVYDWTQTADECRDGDVFVFAGGKGVGILMEAWPVLVAGKAEELHSLAAGTTWETVDGGKYAAAAAVARKLAGIEAEESAPIRSQGFHRDENAIEEEEQAEANMAAEEAATATLQQQNEALRAALQKLVKLHHDWSCGSAYVRRDFITENDAAIAAAREALAA